MQDALRTSLAAGGLGFSSSYARTHNDDEGNMVPSRYASTHEPASIRRCWSTWNVLCQFLYTAELIPANPMSFVGRPTAAKTLPRSLPQPAVTALLNAVDRDHESTRRTDWPERDLALILTGLLAGLRADELRRADVGDIRRSTDGGGVLHVREKAARTAPCRSRPSCYR